MNKPILKLTFGSFVILSIIWSCGGSTYMVDSWKAPEAQLKQGDFEKVMVSVLAPNETARRRAEDYIAARNPIFTPSYQVLGKQQVATDTTQSKAILQQQNFDAALTFRLREKNNTQTWVPGTTSGYGYWGYHGMYYGAYYDPGYMREDVNYVVETTLYSLKDKALLWSGITSSMNPSSIERTMDEIVYEVYQRMKKDGLFPDETQNTK